MTKRPTPDSGWAKIAVQIIAYTVLIALAYAGLDKRLAVIETKVQAITDAQTKMASQTAVDDLRRRVEVLERQGGRK